ncbi:alkaline phosphatase family protein [Desulfitobacterium hafniense]|uniref:Nucleotide pyrophosphatase n=5 Tax=root TaxID=1 RepID=Q24Z03_DESHY|nr:alkaline phosphatase family protein [Desulfitobacterium hafniense]KTE91696.1 nucleotide pyrophosphatase [Desulfitobacterium hafniense]BAE82739.1 hypothetical protein DSY0950 [Desulfitobacterium hafniense Y51]
MNRGSTSEKVIVLGIDGMDPRITKKLVDEGKLPNIRAFIERGSAREDLVLMGAIPTVTPPCWTTLATGAYPGTHGITDFWRQSRKNLDAVTYNLNSQFCEAEPLWNTAAAAGKKTLVWHWPGSSWPPTSDSPNLHVVDGTQPESVNMAVACIDWERIVVANEDVQEVVFVPKMERAQGMGCIITDLNDLLGEKENQETSADLWFSGEITDGRDMKTYIMTYEDTELYVGCRIAYDVVNSPLKEAVNWADAPEGAKEFTVLTSDGLLRRPALILKGEDGTYDRVALYRSKKDTQPLVVVKRGEMIGDIVDTIQKDEKTYQGSRAFKVLELAEDGSEVRFWMSAALDIANDDIWSPPSLYQQVIQNVGLVPPVGLVGGENPELIEHAFIPAWEIYCQWQARALNHLIAENQYDLVFSHLHNVDCGGHQLWHCAKNQPEWAHTDEKQYQGFIEEFYRQTDRYLGQFLHYLDENYTVLIVSDHGLIVGEGIPPVLGDSSGVTTGVMEELGYTVLEKDENGESLRNVDWSKTKAINSRAHWIYLNLKGRYEHGIVDPAEKYALEEQIIDDLYNYRDPKTGKRIVSIAMRDKEAAILGVNGKDCGDIFFCIEEGFSRVHGDSLPTYWGYANTSVSPVFIAAGQGIKQGYQTERVIRQVDVAPTIAALMGIGFPRECEGAPVYQIFKEAF